MGDFINLILSNKYLMILVLSLIGVIIFFVIKKMTKLIIYGFIILAAILAYILYSGKLNNTALEPVQNALKKIK